MNIPHGIRAASSDGARFTSMGSVLTKDNYPTWSSKIKTVLLVNRVWDLVTGTRTRPDPALAAIVVAGAAHANQAEITAANKSITEFEDAYLRASCLIAASISDTEILAFTDVPRRSGCDMGSVEPEICKKVENGG